MKTCTQNNTMISATDIQPGMIINISNINGFRDYVIVIGVNGYDPIEYTYYGVNDNECMIGTLIRNTTIELVNDNDTRDTILQYIRKSMHDKLCTIENDILIIDLIISMNELQHNNQLNCVKK